MLREGTKPTTVFLIGWSIFSFVLLLFIGWSYLRSSVYQSGVDAGFQAGSQAGFDNGVQQGAQQGATSAAGQIYTDIINKAANSECNTVFVEFEGRRVDLINVQCLQVQQPTDQTVDDPDANRG